MVIILGYLIGGLFVALMRRFWKAIAVWLMMIAFVGIFFGSILKVGVTALNKDFDAVMNFKVLGVLCMLNLVFDILWPFVRKRR